LLPVSTNGFSRRNSDVISFLFPPLVMASLLGWGWLFTPLLNIVLFFRNRDRSLPLVILNRQQSSTCPAAFLPFLLALTSGTPPQRQFPSGHWVFNHFCTVGFLPLPDARPRLRPQLSSGVSLPGEYQPFCPGNFSPQPFLPLRDALSFPFTCCSSLFSLCCVFFSPPRFTVRFRCWLHLRHANPRLPPPTPPISASACSSDSSRLPRSEAPRSLLNPSPALFLSLLLLISFLMATPCAPPVPTIFGVLAPHPPLFFLWTPGVLGSPPLFTTSILFHSPFFLRKPPWCARFFSNPEPFFSVVSVHLRPTPFLFFIPGVLFSFLFFFFFYPGPFRLVTSNFCLSLPNIAQV